MQRESRGRSTRRTQAECMHTSVWCSPSWFKISRVNDGTPCPSGCSISTRCCNRCRIQVFVQVNLCPDHLYYLDRPAGPSLPPGQSQVDKELAHLAISRCVVPSSRRPAATRECVPHTYDHIALYLSLANSLSFNETSGVVAACAKFDGCFSSTKDGFRADRAREVVLEQLHQCLAPVEQELKKRMNCRRCCC